MPKYLMSIISNSDDVSIHNDLEKYCKKNSYKLHINRKYDKEMLRNISLMDVSQYYIFISDFVTINNFSKKIDLPGKYPIYYCKKKDILDSNLIIVSEMTLERIIDHPTSFINVQQLSMWEDGYILDNNELISSDPDKNTIFLDLSL